MIRVRAQCIVVRDDRILLVKHRVDGKEWWALPGGGVEDGETPEEAVLREIQEECNVGGTVIRKTSEGYTDTHAAISFLVDICDQEPSLGIDPELREKSLIDVRWFKLNELSERDRAFLWAAGLLTVSPFGEEVLSWDDDVSYPKE